MSTQTEITRLQNARNKLRNKGVELGLCLTTDKMDAIATKFDTIQNQGSVSAQVQEGDTFTIPAGYHNGSGTVSGVAGGGSYTLQSKTVTPTKASQSITPDAGNYGLSDVTVEPIPAAYQDVSGTTATKDNVLATKTFVGADGALVAGTMPNNGAVAKTLTKDAPTYTVAKGYHDGTGVVSVVVEAEKSVTPTSAEQTIAPTTGNFLSTVVVSPIPSNYKDTTGTDAVAGNLLAGKKAVTALGAITGTMANNGAVSATIDGLNTTSYVIPAGYHDGTGSVAMTNNIELALADI